MRYMILAAALCLPVAAYADDSIAGTWIGKFPDNVVMTMKIAPNGKWSSETRQNGSEIGSMDGTYTQTIKDGQSGTLIFRPVKSNVSTQHGPAKMETDSYSLQDHGNTLSLDSGGDKMVFHR